MELIHYFIKKYDYFKNFIIYNIVYYYKENSNNNIGKKIIKRNW